MIHSYDAPAADDAVVCMPNFVEIAVEAKLDEGIVCSSIWLHLKSLLLLL